MRLRTCLAAVVLCGAALAIEEKPAVLTYPPTARGPASDDYFGTPVPDPYRWLENLDSPQTRAWIEAQNRVTYDFLDTLPGRATIRQRLKTLWDFEKYEVPFREGGRYFYSRNDGIQNQSVLYTLDRLDAEPRVLLDPNTLSHDGTVALGGLAVSRDGRHLAYAVSRSGSDWQEWRVRTVDGAKDLAEELRWVKFSNAAWRADSKGFYYARYDEPRGAVKSAVNYYQKLYYHQLGTPQAADTLVYQRKDRKEWGFEPQVTEDGHYLVINVWRGTDPRSACFYQDLTRPDAPVVELLNTFDAAYQFLGNDGPVFYFLTDKDAPRQRIVAIDTAHPEAWRELVPQARETLTRVTCVAGRFIAHYLADARSQVRIHDRTGKLEREIALPGPGTADGFAGHPADTETFFSFTSFATPPEIWRLDPATGATTLFRRPKLGFDPAAFETRQVWVTSKDGTRFPVFLSGAKGFQPNEQPLLLYGYGGFNISVTPAFSPENLVWMQLGGLYASANIRGGGEYGEDWHQSGTRSRKQNGFDDFIAAAEYLIANNWTTRSRLGIHGRSNGGLLVGAAMTQRPDLFACALPGVGVLDMLRYHTFTIGWAWSSDYGTAATREGFETLYRYSPLHNLKAGTRYPPTLITTGDHDDRVVPAHSYKFAATLQERHRGDAPVLIRIDVKAGHGAGKPTSKRIEESADRLTFLAHMTKLNVP